ncbi:UNVERIFIED_CONTAM: hypothetical protein Scaly_1380300 [Sesamum calycinum]|uniref:Uncharacterized protein n=1 Tax=Sesamum calycinum TaxID=2727403 RepID=A0AAW2PR93_9LAMI
MLTRHWASILRLYTTELPTSASGHKKPPQISRNVVHESPPSLEYARALLKSTPSNSRTNFGCFCSELNSRASVRRSIGLRSSGIITAYRRFRVSCKVEGSGDQSNEVFAVANTFFYIKGLIPRAKLLLTLGGTFFLGFWPLILVTVASFSALYLYFGPEFVHDGSKAPISPPQYVDPYALLEEERIYKTAPLLN